MTTNDIISTNLKRLQRLFSPYDPVAGIGSPLARIPLTFQYQNNTICWHVPATMQPLPAVQLLQKEVNILQIVIKHVHNSVAANAECDFYKGLFNDRLKHDFEFWAATCAKIQHKKTKTIIPFVLNMPQRKVLVELERMRLADLPIRMILLKARQWGGSTCIQLYMQWIQIFHRERWHTCIVANVESQAINVRSMYDLVAQYHPNEVQHISLKPFKGSQKTRIFTERNTIMSIGSMEAPDSLRSQDIMMAHLSEIGLWKETEGKKPEDIIQTIAGTVPNVPYSMIIKESTAKGVDNYFHRCWIDSVNGNTNDVPVFIAWFEIEMCADPICKTFNFEIPFASVPQSRRDFQLLPSVSTDGLLTLLSPEDISLYTTIISTLNDYEKYLWQIGATLEGINWYRVRLKEFKGDMWRMQSENPCTPQEAFQSTGARVFPPSFGLRAREDCCDPTSVGDIFIDTPSDLPSVPTGLSTSLPSVSTYGIGSRAAMKRTRTLGTVRYEPYAGGNLSIWIMPDTTINLKHRYAAFADIGGTTYNADYSVIKVIDRYPMLHGGVPEIVATWRGHINQIDFAWKCAALAEFYNRALLAIEVNSERNTEDPESGDYVTIFGEISNVYRNLYHYTKPEDVRAHKPTKWGFFTNRVTKRRMMNTLRTALEVGGYIERDIRACDEMDSYEIKPDGSYGAVAKGHDDLVICTAGVVQIATQEMPAPATFDPDRMLLPQMNINSAAMI
jgi:hypothetical protein